MFRQEKVFAVDELYPRQESKQHQFNTFELSEHTSAGHQLRLHTRTEAASAVTRVHQSQILSNAKP
jgi:hypothetical protein